MSTRASLRLIGLLLLVPSLALGALPLISAYTDWLANVSNFDLRLGSLPIATLYEGEATAGVFPYLVAAIGELFLIAASLQTVRQSRYLISPRS